MSLSQRFWDFIFPLTSALSACMSHCPSTLCQVGENQPDLDDSTSISTSESFYTPIPPPSLHPIRSISLAHSSVAPDVNKSSSQSLPLVSQSSPRPLTHPSYVILNQDVVFIILCLMDPATLGRCARVCRLWWKLATSILWRKDALSIGMHPLLGYIDTYYLDPPVHPVSTFFVSECTL